MKCFVLCIQADNENARERIRVFLETNRQFLNERQNAITVYRPDGSEYRLDYDYEFIDLPDPTLQTFVEKAAGHNKN